MIKQWTHREWYDMCMSHLNELQNAIDDSWHGGSGKITDAECVRLHGCIGELTRLIYDEDDRVKWPE